MYNLKANTESLKKYGRKTIIAKIDRKKHPLSNNKLLEFENVINM